jgi:hypothetical protein
VHKTSLEKQFKDYNEFGTHIKKQQTFVRDSQPKKTVILEGEEEFGYGDEKPS